MTLGRGRIDKNGIAYILGAIFAVWIIEGVALILIGAILQFDLKIRIALIILGISIIALMANRIYNHWKHWKLTQR